MREILFRAQRVDNGEWVYGSLITAIVSKDKKSINTFIKLQDAVKTNLETFLVKPESIGQFTGLLDKNGNKIFEGDIVLYDFDNLNYRIEFLNGCFLARFGSKNIKDIYPDEFNYGTEVQIIGNIHEDGYK